MFAVTVEGANKLLIEEARIIGKFLVFVCIGVAMSREECYVSKNLLGREEIAV